MKYKNPLPHLNFKSDKKCLEEKHVSSDHFQRINLRKNNEIRDMFVKVGEDGRSEASCFYSLGNTKVLALIFGPKPDVRKTTFDRGRVRLEVKSLNISPTKTDDKSEDEITNLLTDCLSNIILLNKYPQCCIHIKCLIVKGDGGCLAATLTCISLALTKAQIQTVDTVVAIHINAVRCPKTKRILHIVDLDKTEENYYKKKYEVNALTLGFCLNLKTICFFHGSGDFFNNSILAEMLHYAEGSCRSLGDEIKKVLKAYLIKHKMVK